MNQEARPKWTINPDATFARRIGKSPAGDSERFGGCPDIWELSNGDFAVIGRDATEMYRSALPKDVSVTAAERLVVVPRDMVIAAKVDIPDA